MAQEINLPLAGDVYTGVDPVSLKGDFGPELYDAFIDEFGSMNKRPGHKTSFIDLGTDTGIDGLFWWNTGGFLIACSGGSTFTVKTPNSPSKVDITNASGQVMVPGNRVSFIDDGEVLYLANGETGLGRDVFSWSGVGTVDHLTDVDVPANVTHIAYLDKYLLMLKAGTGEFMYAGPIDRSDPSSLNFYTAESAPDDLVALAVAKREILLVGERTTEIWFNDGASPFSRRGNGIVEVGSDSPYSLTEANGSWFWFSNHRQLIEMPVLTPQIISSPFDKEFEGFGTVSDCIIDRIKKSGRDFLVMTFPTESKSYAYDLKLRKWSRWSHFIKQTADRERYIANSVVYAKDWNKWLIGDYSSGNIYELDDKTWEDGSDPIALLRRTAFINHGVRREKAGERIVFDVKSATGNSDVTDPSFMLRFRNEKGGWKKERTISLGAIGVRDQEPETRRLGKYKSRQYEISHTDPAPFILAGAMETVEGMTR